MQEFEGANVDTYTTQSALPVMSSEVTKIATALCKAQSQFKPAPKTAENPYFNSRYSDLATVMDVLRKPLADNGLAIFQSIMPSHDNTKPGVFVVITTLIHTSGEWMRSYLPISPQQNTPQGIGSAITYARRYGIQALVALPSGDDDGESAEGRGEGNTQGESADELVEKIQKAVESAEDMGKLMQLWGDAVKVFGQDNIPDKVSNMFTAAKKRVAKKK